MARSLLPFTFVACLFNVYPAFGQNAPASSDSLPFDSTWITADDAPTRGDLFSILENIRQHEPDADSPQHLGSYAFTLRFVFPTDVMNDRVNHTPRSNEHFGIDINYGTSSKLDFNALHDQGVEFVYARATVGPKRYDSQFDKFWPKLAAIKSGPHGPVFRGAYHFLLPGSAEAQANSFISYIKHVDPAGIGADDLPPGLDLEWTSSDPTKDSWIGHDPDEIVDTVLTVLKKFEAEWHRSAILYTNAGWWNERTAGFPGKHNILKRITDAGFALWIADYRGSDLSKEVPTTPVGMPWAIWQFTAKSELDHGYPTKEICYKADGKPQPECLDASVFKGTDAEFKKTFGLK